jgi:hypothetical protein
MGVKDSNIINVAVSFAAKFGFLTQDIFFDFMCPRAKTQRYAYWNHLLDQNIFKSARRDAKVLYLSKESLRSAGPQAARRRYFYHVEHDAIAARLLLNLERAFTVARSWTENELRSNPIETISILGAGDNSKLPDLVVDLEGPTGYLRVAIEVEKTAKARERYRQISLSYLAMKRVNLVIYLCDSVKLESTIDASFSGELFVKSEKRPGFVQLKELRKDWLQAPVRFLNREMPLMTLLATASKAELKVSESIPNLSRTAVRDKFGILNPEKLKKTV